MNYGTKPYTLPALLCAILITTGCAITGPSKSAEGLIQALDTHGCQINRMRVTESVTEFDCRQRGREW